MTTTHLLDDCIHYRRLKAIAQRQIRIAASTHWKKYCGELNNATKLGAVWAMNRKMNGLNSKKNIPSLIHNNTTSYTALEAANMLAETFENNSSDSNYNSDFLIRKTNCE